MENQSDVIMIPVKEYRKLCMKVAKLKLKLKDVEEQLRDEKESASNRYDWWKEEEALREGLETKVKELEEKVRELSIEELP